MDPLQTLLAQALSIPSYSMPTSSKARRMQRHRGSPWGKGKGQHRGAVPLRKGQHRGAVPLRNQHAATPLESGREAPQPEGFRQPPISGATTQQCNRTQTERARCPAAQDGTGQGTG